MKICYSTKPFMPYTVHWTFHFFIILFSETSLPLSSFFLSSVLLAVVVKAPISEEILSSSHQ
jgi:hypothetical protein